MIKQFVVKSGIVTGLLISALAPSVALAEAAPTAQANPYSGLFLMIGMVVLFYFILIRPQQKRMKEHRKMVSDLAKGDEVITSGGILGKVTDVTEGYLIVEIADNVSVKLQNSAVTTVLPKGSIKDADK